MCWLSFFIGIGAGMLLAVIILGLLLAWEMGR